MSTEEDLIILIDFCEEMATRIRNDWSDPRTECRAIWDAHDMAHFLTGGDRTRKDWGHVRLFARDSTEDKDGASWPDVRRRLLDLYNRLEAQSE